MQRHKIQQLTPAFTHPRLSNTAEPSNLKVSFLDHENAFFEPSLF